MLKEDAEIGHICGNEGSSGSIGIANKETQRDKNQYQRQQLTGLRKIPKISDMANTVAL